MLNYGNLPNATLVYADILLVHVQETSEQRK